MGKINKRFTVSSGDKHVGAIGKIDSGADISVVRLDIGYKLGVDPKTSDAIALHGLGYQRVLGFRIPATMRIGKTAAKIDLAVPAGTFDPETREFKPLAQRNNLIGHDFLQATGASLDFSRPKGHAFVEGNEGHVGDVEVLEVNPAEERALRKWAKFYLARVATGRYSLLKPGTSVLAAYRAGAGTRHRFSTKRTE